MSKSKKSRGAAPSFHLAMPELAVKSPTKLSILISLMQRGCGASLAEMQEATGWQAHSVRGALSGSIAKAKGIAVTSRLVGAQRRYFIDGAF